MRLHIGALLALLLMATSVEAREWTDASGQHRREAELLRRDGDMVYMQDAVGNRLRVGFNRLSVADQQFILDSEQAGNEQAQADQPAVEAKTLGFRRVVANSAQQAVAPVKTAGRSDGSLFKLTGWSCCTPWYCHHPCPPPAPLPPKPPLPEFGKRIYCGKWSTWHLIRLNPGVKQGTGDYLLSDPNGQLVRRLGALQFQTGNANSWVYRVITPDPGYLFWRFSSIATHHCWYKVEYSNDQKNWYFYEYCTAKLPR